MAKSTPSGKDFFSSSIFDADAFWRFRGHWIREADRSGRRPRVCVEGAGGVLQFGAKLDAAEVALLPSAVRTSRRSRSHPQARDLAIGPGPDNDVRELLRVGQSAERRETVLKRLPSRHRRPAKRPAATWTFCSLTAFEISSRSNSGRPPCRDRARRAGYSLADRTSTHRRRRGSARVRP